MPVLLELEPNQIDRIYSYAVEARRLANDFFHLQNEPKKRNPLIERKISGGIGEMQTIDRIYGKLVNSLKNDFLCKVHLMADNNPTPGRWGIRTHQDLPWFWMTRERFHDFVNVIFENYQERDSTRYKDSRADLLVRVCQTEPLVIVAKTRTPPTPIEEMLKQS